MRFKITRLFPAFLIILSFVIFASAQIPYSEDQFRVYDSKGNPATIDQIIKDIGENEVVFLGEGHDDAVGHAVQMEIFRRAVEQFSATRKVALSLEMFERDTQTVLNEYLAGQITEKQFLDASRPWGNYKTDYRPLVELAKAKKLAVIAANAPRRYVNMVSRNGRDSLNALSPQARAWLAPLPYGEPSAAYSAKFKALMGASAEASQGLDRILASQSLWDATMANSVADYLKTNKNSLLVHLNGAFHTENRLGTVEHLLKYRPKAKALVVTIRYQEDFKTFDKTKQAEIGDYVILTDTKSNELVDVLRKMKAHHDGLQSVRANVTMVRYDSNLKESDVTNGKLTYMPQSSKHPIYVRVDWTKPVIEQILVIGESYELYRPTINTVIGGTLAKAKRNELSFLSMSSSQLRTNFSITIVGKSVPFGNEKATNLEMKPKMMSGAYTSAELWVNGDGMPIQARVNFKNGDIITITLSEIQKNVSINSSVFRLDLPAGVKKITL